MEKEHYSEKEAADTIRPLVDAMRYCHGMNIIHRDLKVSYSSSLKARFNDNFKIPNSNASNSYSLL